jgi:hypothetical protein
MLHLSFLIAGIGRPPYIGADHEYCLSHFGRSWRCGRNV